MNKLPKKWVIKSTKNSEVHKWFEKKLNRDIRAGYPSYFHYPEVESYVCTFDYPLEEKGYTEITYEQFKDLVLKEKEIIGYRLVKPEFEAAAARTICNDGSYRFREKADGTNFAVSSITHGRLKQAGVLDLWFEPVYNESKVELVLSSGEEVTIKEGYVFYENDYLSKRDILKIRNCFKLMIVDNYKVKPTKVKIGCLEVTEEDVDRVLAEL